MMKRLLIGRETSGKSTLAAHWGETIGLSVSLPVIEPGKTFWQSSRRLPISG